jgi:hypothetical protein
MRDLLNILDSVITEGVGLSNRKPGEKFKNNVDDIITFQGLQFFPNSGAYPAAELESAIATAAESLEITPDRIHWTNTTGKTDTGFGIATFTGETGENYYLGRYFKTVSPNRSQNNFPHEAIPGNFKYQSKVGQKENSPLKPSAVLTQFKDNTPETILQQVIAKFGANSDEARALEIFMREDIPCKVPKGNMNPEAFRDYFAEMLQPIALVMGKKVAGNAAEAARIFFGSGGYSDCTISFNNNTIGGLYDSLLVNPDGKQIKLSSKGKDGASASVVNLLKTVKELEATPNGQQLLTKHAEAIEILETINRDGHFGAPLKLAIKYDMLSPEEAAQVLKLKNKGPNDEIIGTGQLSDRLEKMYEGRKAKDPSRIIPIEHMLAAIAYPVADHINKKTGFGQAASEILNNGALVQMYTDTTVSGDTITITKLTAVYPSQTITGVELDASKVYFSTGGKGNYTFTILKNGAKAADVNQLDSVDDIGTPSPETDPEAVTDRLDRATDRRLTGPGARAARSEIEPRTDSGTLGRERRRR